MEKYAGNLPAKKVRKAKSKPSSLGAAAGAQLGQRPGKRVIRKADTGDITRNLTPASKRKLAATSPTVTVRPKGTRTHIVVDTGDILHDVTGVPAPRPKAVKRPSFGEALKQELEGKGALAEGLKRASGPVSKALVPHNEPLMYKGKAVRNVDTAGIPGVHANLTPFARRAAQDLVNFPAQAVPSVYVPVAAAVEAAGGHPARGKQLLHDLPHTDPVAALVTGHPGRALKIAGEHPGFAALEVIGAKGAAGRGAGRVMRRAPKGSRVHAAASTTRADRVVPGTTLAQKQSYSPDVTRKAVQVIGEKRKAKRAAVIHAQGVRTGDPELLANAGRMDPARMSDQEIRKRVDERVAANETIRRHNRTVATEEAHRAITNTVTPTGGPVARAKVIASNRRTRVEPTAATTLRAQAITSATAHDLAAYRDELAAVHDTLGPSQALANRTLRKQIDKAIAKRPDPVALKAAAERYAQVVAPRQEQLVAHGLLDAAQVEKAPLVPYAVRHMEGVKAGEHGPTIERRVTRTEPGKPVVRLVGAGEKRYKAALPPRRDFIAAQPKAHRGDTPQLDRLTENLPPGKPGIAIEREHLRYTDPRTKKTVGFGAEMRGGAHVVVKRDASGKIIGALHMLVDSEGRPTVLSAAVDPAHRGQGIASALAKAAHDAGYDLRHAEDAYTTAGAALKHKVISEHDAAGEVVTRRYVTRREPGPPVTVDVGTEHVPLSAAEIRAHMQRSGVEPPAYVTQAPGQRGEKNFFVSSGRPPQLSTGRRTGSATVKGTLDAHPDVLREGAAKAQGLVDAADGFTATVHEFAHKPTLGKLKTKQEADQAARDLQASTGQHWRPVRIQPFGGNRAQIKALLDKATGEGGLDENVGAAQPVREAMDSAIRGMDGPGPWALMPEAAAAQFAAHLHTLGVGPKAKALQVVGSGFRRTVLSTSPTWMTGNVTEAALRSGLARAGPRSYVTGRRAVRRLEQIDPKAAQELTARATGGGHFSMADRQHIRRDSTQFAGSTTLEPLARGLGAFWRAPVAKHVAQAWHGWTDLVFRQLNGRLESQFQTAMLGKALRDSPLMDGNLRKLSQQAIDQAAHGLRDTNEQARFAREVERMYGKYNAFSPDTRWAIATYTPFIAWTANAVRFVYDVLPKDHPAATALIAASENATAEWRKDHGLDLFMKGALPGFLQGSIPLSGGRHQRAPFRYTPFGAFGDPLDTAAGAVLPQFSGVLAAFKGQDWKGAKLRNPDGSPADIGTKAKAAASSFIDATVPIVAQGKRIGTKGVGALNPVAPIAPKPKKVRVSAGAARTSEQDINALLADPTQRDIDALLNNLP